MQVSVSFKKTVSDRVQLFENVKNIAVGSVYLTITKENGYDTVYPIRNIDLCKIIEEPKGV